MKLQCVDMPVFERGDYVKYGRVEARVIAVFTHPTQPTVYRILVVEGERREIDATALDLVRSP